MPKKKKAVTEKDLPRRYERLQEFAQKARLEVERILKIVLKEGDLSSKLLKRKMDLIGLDTKVEKKYMELGKETYNLIEAGKISESKLVTLVKEIDKLYDSIEKNKKDVDGLKKLIKKTVAKK